MGGVGFVISVATGSSQCAETTSAAFGLLGKDVIMDRK
jgi:hypothetical protein